MMIQQVKSQWYYIFWGIMAAAVCSGQVYVGLGYREMARATQSSHIQVTCVPEYVPPVRNKTTNSNGEFE